MKNYIKGIITGIIIGAVICSIPALADTIDALFNNVHISVNGVDQIQWDENIKLSDGAETPASILYNGTTYLPMRKLGELSGNKIYWNGDSRTVGMTGAQKDIKVIAEKPDKNGNVWKYYTFTDSNDKNYLGVKDEARGYERVYNINSRIHVTDNEIFFVKYGKKDGPYGTSYQGSIMKLPFTNDPDTQDGEVLKKISYMSSGGIVNDRYACYMLNIPGNAAHTEFYIYNYVTGEEICDRSHGWSQKFITNIEETDTEIIISYTEYYIHGEEMHSKLVYNKETKSFNE